MGAYENPAMIKQTAGLYWARAIESLGQSGANAINGIFEEQRKQAELERQKTEKDQSRRNSLMTNSWSTLEGIRTDTLKAMGPDASDIAIEDLNGYISENGQAFVENDSRVIGGYGTPEEQKQSLEFSTNFKTTAAKKVNAAKNYQQTLDGYKKAIGSKDYNFVDDDSEFAFTILSNQRAGTKGIGGYSAVIDENEQGDNELTLTVTGVDRNINDGLDDSFFQPETGDYVYKVNLNKLDQSQVFVKSLPGVDSTEIAKSTGVVNEDNVINESKAGIITKGNTERTYYTSSSFGEALSAEVGSTVDSWYAVNDSRTHNEIKGQLKAWGLNKIEIDNFLNDESGIDAIKAKMIQREFNRVYSGKKQQAAVIPVSQDVINEINEINKSRPNGAKLDVPNIGDLIGYSQRTIATEVPKITDAQRKNYTSAQIYDNLVVPDVERIYNSYQGDSRAELYIQNIKANNPEADVVSAKQYIDRLAQSDEDVRVLVNEGKYEEAASEAGLESSIGVVYYKTVGGAENPTKVLDTYVSLTGDEDAVKRAMLTQTAKLYGLTQKEASAQYLKYMGGKASETEEVDEFAEFEEQQD